MNIICKQHIVKYNSGKIDDSGWNTVTIISSYYIIICIGVYLSTR